MAESSQSSSTSLQTSFKFSSHLGVNLNVTLADMPLQGNLALVEQSQMSASHPSTASLESCGHRLFVAATIVSPDHPTVPLDDRSLGAIIRPMLQDINSLRNGWLNLSDLHARPSAVHQRLLNPGQVPESHNAFQHAVVVHLVPVSVPAHPTSNRRYRVDLEWVDARLEHPVPLADLFQPTSLPLHLRDLVSQLTSRLLVQLLLRDSASAKLYHRSWQHRQRDTVPLICSIASSMRALLSRASNPTELGPYLHQLHLSQALPNIITLTNLLTDLDLTCHPPSPPPSIADTRMRSQLDTTCRQIVSSVDFAADGPDSDYDWLDADTPQPTPQDRQEEQHDETDRLLLFAPEHDEDGGEADTCAAWADILRFSKDPLPARIKTEDHPQQGFDGTFVDSPRTTGPIPAQQDFRSQHMSVRAKFKA